MGHSQVLYNYLLLNRVEISLEQSLLCVVVRTENLTILEGKGHFAFLGAGLTVAERTGIIFFLVTAVHFRRDSLPELCQRFLYPHGFPLSVFWSLQCICLMCNLFGLFKIKVIVISKTIINFYFPGRIYAPICAL